MQQTDAETMADEQDDTSVFQVPNQTGPIVSLRDHFEYRERILGDALRAAEFYVCAMNGKMFDREKQEQAARQVLDAIAMLRP